MCQHDRTGKLDPIIDYLIYDLRLKPTGKTQNGKWYFEKMGYGYFYFLDDLPLEKIKNKFTYLEQIDLCENGINDRSNALTIYGGWKEDISIAEDKEKKIWSELRKH